MGTEQANEAYQRMRDEARARAQQLRVQAMHAFWDEAGAMTLNSARAATRYAHALARHWRLRALTSEECTR